MTYHFQKAPFNDPHRRNYGAIHTRQPIPKQTGRRQSTYSYIDYGGYLSELERNPMLSLRERWTTFHNLRRSVLIVSSSIERIQNFMYNTDWSLAAADDTPEAESLRDQMEEILFAKFDGWRAAAVDLASNRWNGFALSEWTRSPYMDGKTYLTGLHNVDPATVERFYADPLTGEIYGFMQRDPITGWEHELDRNKFAYAKYRTDNGSPDGGGGLMMLVVEQAVAHREYFRKSGLAFDREFIGDILVRAPLSDMNRELAETGEFDGDEPVLDAAQRQQIIDDQVRPLKNYVTDSRRNILRGHQRFVMVDSDTYESETTAGLSHTPNKKWDLEVLQGEHAPHDSMLMTKQAIERSIARIFSTEDSLLGEGATGNRELASTKLSTFRTMIEALSAQVCMCFDMDVIKPFAEMNGLPTDREVLPRMQFDLPKEITPTEKMALLSMASEVSLKSPYNDTAAINKIRTEAGVLPLEEEAIMEIEADNEFSREMQEANLQAEKNNASNGGPNNGNSNNGG